VPDAFPVTADTNGRSASIYVASLEMRSEKRPHRYKLQNQQKIHATTKLAILYP
jgi:hypothetical protein